LITRRGRPKSTNLTPKQRPKTKNQRPRTNLSG
jgi:hypothetical protein